MKVLQFLILVFSIFGVSSITKAQACCPSTIRLYVFDEKGISFSDAQVKIRGRNADYNSQTNAYSISSLGGCDVAYQVSLEVNANGFEKFEKIVEVNSGFFSYELRLKPKSSKKSPIFEELSTLKGIVKDQSGGVIPNTVVVLTDAKGNRFEKLTNENGHFAFEVKSGNYFLEFIGTAGFKTKKYEKFELAKGYKYLDVVLEIKPCDDCGVWVGTGVEENKKP